MTTVTSIQGSYVKITSLKGDDGNTPDKWVGGSKYHLQSIAWAGRDEEIDLEHLGEGNPYHHATSPEPIPRIQPIMSEGKLFRLRGYIATMNWQVDSSVLRPRNEDFSVLSNAALRHGSSTPIFGQERKQQFSSPRLKQIFGER